MDLLQNRLATMQRSAFENRCCFVHFFFVLQNTRAYGPGLQKDGLLQMQPAPFKVDAPADTLDALEIRVIGPEGDFLPSDKVKVVPREKGKWECEYLPEEPGEYKILVMLGGFHVPGSVFTVTVAKDDSIGGAGSFV